MNFSDLSTVIVDQVQKNVGFLSRPSAFVCSGRFGKESVAVSGRRDVVALVSGRAIKIVPRLKRWLLSLAKHQ